MKNRKKLHITQSYLKSVLRYDENTGVFIRIKSRFSQYVGKPAGSLNSYNYVVIYVDYKSYYAHRLAWLYVYGDTDFTKYDIDHINGNKSDNKITNLRLAKRSENCRNENRKLKNKHGLKGVSYIPNRKGSKKWTSCISKDHKKYYLGFYFTKEEAYEAYLKKEKELYSKFIKD